MTDQNKKRLMLVALIAGFVLLILVQPEAKPEKNTELVDQICAQWAKVKNLPFEQCDRKQYDDMLEKLKQDILNAAGPIKAEQGSDQQ